ncbi:hypothetical protein K445DRAFT_167617 [Daldinia sp. EC12]|nr:hypothetical protein F4774DRAFT_423332 [Daldinia eschscholtzii]OTB13303.1 hypothetical protein K445DRAFT_167617 [Daldinia sp. EC12]
MGREACACVCVSNVYGQCFCTLLLNTHPPRCSPFIVNLSFTSHDYDYIVHDDLQEDVKQGNWNELSQSVSITC